MKETFLKELESLINKYSLENESDTPDFMLAEYVRDCMYAYVKTVEARDKWFGVDMWSENKFINATNQSAESNTPKQ